MTVAVVKPKVAAMGGNTAVLALSNTSSLLIRLKDEETVEYQYVSERVEPIQEATIQYEMDENLDDDDVHPCFYAKEGAGPYFLHEFIRTNYPNI